jgi:hypothetical protein
VGQQKAEEPGPALLMGAASIGGPGGLLAR